MAGFPRTLLLLAAPFALAASILSSTTEGREYIIDEDAGPYERVVRQSWYESQGLWGVVILVIFAALYFAPYHFFARGALRLSALFAIIALVLTYLAVFSIGLYYLPAAGALVLAFIALGVTRRRQQ